MPWKIPLSPPAAAAALSMAIYARPAANTRRGGTAYQARIAGSYFSTRSLTRMRGSTL